MPAMDRETRTALGALTLLKAEGGSRPGTLYYSYLLMKSTILASVTAPKLNFCWIEGCPFLPWSYESWHNLSFSSISAHRLLIRGPCDHVTL